MKGSTIRFPWKSGNSRGERSTFWLRRRIQAALLLVSAVPFLSLGAGAWFVFRDVAIDQTLGLHRTMARAHAVAIEMYLAEKRNSLEVIARTHTVEELRRPERLREIFDAMAGVYQHGFVDLGVIDHEGRHLAYVGPFDLMDRTYFDAEWFQTVMAEGSLVSDVFLGHRQAPHSVVAVRQPSPDGWWVLRATLDNRSLYSLVRSLEVGATGDVFLVNGEGLFQTPPRMGAVLGESPLVDPPYHPEVRDQRVEDPRGENMRQVTTWLNDGHWLLVVQQPEREILAPVRRAVASGALVVAFALILVFVATILITSHLIRRVERADRQRDLMHRDLLRSAKLASLGEMSSGLAHEINNPLAIISAEQTNLGDEIGDLDLPPAVRETLEEAIQRCKRQVERCGNITAKMLQFGRKTDTLLQATDVEPVLREIGQLLERRARNSNVALVLRVAPRLPPAWLDANELEQVLANLVNNAVDAMEHGGTVTASARKEGSYILLQVADTGSGIPPEDLDRIFQPFFTTKPVGQGTGLGLAVVYGIVQGWGGTIQAESKPGEGTTMSVRIPLASDREPMDAWHGE
jgi:two-component system, NtrC family, sensor kinase